MGLKPEPAIEVQDLDLDRIHLSRWSTIPAAALDDERLLELYYFARVWGLRAVMNGAAAPSLSGPRSR